MASSGCWVANVVLGVPSSLWSSLLLRGERSRCASSSGSGRPCDYTTQVLALLRERGGASDSVPRQSAPTSSCASEACTRSANCAEAGDSTVQFFDVVYVPTVVR